MEFSEDEAIIGTPKYAVFQRLASTAGDLAVYEAKKAGLPVTYVDADDRIVTEYADGRKDVIGNAPPWVPVSQTVYAVPPLTEGRRD